LSQLVWSKAFVRAFKQMSRRDPQLRDRVEKTLSRLAKDHTDPILHVHKLKGELGGAWACLVDYNVRILFELVENPETSEREVLLLTMGTHEPND
jgi:mRNA-degrading endonuclease YafQ of YafQ-DinJ toxin-antitoxin module